MNQKLLEYLNSAEGVSFEDRVRDLAEKVNSTPLYIKRVAKGWQRPGPKLTLRIEGVTGGRVSRGDLRPDLWT